MAGKLKVGVLVSGSGTNLQALMDACDRNETGGALIAAVVSDNPGAYALARAGNHSIPCFVIRRKDYQSKEDFDRAMVAFLKERGVELVCLAGFMRIVTKVFIEAFPRGVLNIHPSLLPQFPGLHAQKQAIEHGVKISGCTVHFVDEKVDHGPIVIQAAVPVLDGDTEESLRDRILAYEHKIYPLAVRLVAEGRARISGRSVLTDGGAGDHGRAVVSPPLEI